MADKNELGHGDMVIDLTRAAREAAHRPHPNQDRTERGFDLISTAPGLVAWLTDRGRQVFDDGNPPDRPMPPYFSDEKNDDFWKGSIPEGAYKVDTNGSVQLTLKACFDNDGRIKSSDAWVLMPRDSVVRIEGSNGTYWQAN